LQQPPASESDLHEAVADLDTPPSGGEAAEAPTYAAAEPMNAEPMNAEPMNVEPTNTEPASSSAQTASPSEPATEPEQPRRRSTVREPAAVFSSDSESAVPPSPPAATPAAQPVITETDANEGARPRRSGWWSRRSAG
jgi:ribonuclease E